MTIAKKNDYFGGMQSNLQGFESRVYAGCYQGAGPSLRTALNYLLSDSCRGHVDNNGVLPSVNVLAESAGVGRDTMMRAARLLRDAGFFAGIRGHRYRFIRPSSPIPAPAHTASGRIADRLHTDILNGVFAPGALLRSNKELQARYGASYPTIRNALRKLVAGRELVASGRGYRVPSAQAARNGARLVLLASGGTDPMYPVLGSAGESVQREMEVACSRAGIKLECLTFPLGSNDPIYRPFGSLRAQRLPDDSLVLGYVVIAVSPRHCPDDLLVRLIATRTPTAVINVAGLHPLPEVITENPYLQVFTVSGAMAPGIHAGRFLHALGHRCIAWISPYHADDWSRRRLAGLQSVFSGNAGTSGVVVEASEKYLENDYLEMHFPPPVVRSQERLYRMWAQRLPLAARLYLDELYDDFVKIGLSRSAMFAELVPRFDRLLENKNITAWVASNDMAAAMALHYLRRRHIKIPDELSLIGFDDTDHALRLGLTSYNFNASALAQAATGFCLNYSSRCKKPQGVVEIEGRMVVRATTGRCATRPCQP